MASQLGQWFYNRRYWPEDTMNFIVWVARDLVPTLMIVSILAGITFTEVMMKPEIVTAQAPATESSPMPASSDNPWHSVGIAILSGLYLLEKSPRLLRYFKGEKPPEHRQNDFIVDKLIKLDLTLHGDGTEDKPGLVVRVAEIRKDLAHLHDDFEKHLDWAERESSGLAKRINGIKDSGQ